MRTVDFIRLCRGVELPDVLSVSSCVLRVSPIGAHGCPHCPHGEDRCYWVSV